MDAGFEDHAVRVIGLVQFGGGGDCWGCMVESQAHHARASRGMPAEWARMDYIVLMRSASDRGQSYVTKRRDLQRGVVSRWPRAGTPRRPEPCWARCP
jgi:hypothetical protein